MYFKWKQAFSKALMSCIAVFGLSSIVYAGPDMKPDAKSKQPHFAFSYPLDMHLANPRDFYFYVDGLALQGMESNLQFVLVSSSTIATQPNAFLGGFGQDESWDYNFGLRAGFGIYVDHDAWNFDFDWMWINITNSQNYQATGGGATLPTWQPEIGLLATDRSSAGANWQATMNVFDATLGKPYYISRKVVFNPHFGLRFAAIDQDYDVSYGGTTPANMVKFRASNDFWGLGARIGFDADWLLGCGFKLFSNLSSSVLAGWFETKEHFATPGSSVQGKLVNEPQMVVPNVELATGLAWGTNLDNCNYFLNLRAGYEFQVWWNQLNMRQFTGGAATGNFTNVPVQGDLTLNGFTLRVQLDM